MLSIALGAIAGAFWPGLSWQDRILAPLAIIVLAVLYYLLAIGLVKFNVLLSPSLRKPSAYFLFYGAVICALTFPLIAISERHELLAQPALMQALTVPGFIPIALAVAAGAVRELHNCTHAA